MLCIPAEAAQRAEAAPERGLSPAGAAAAARIPGLRARQYRAAPGAGGACVRRRAARLHRCAFQQA